MTVEQIRTYLNQIQVGDKGKSGSLKHLAYVIGEEEYNAAKNASKDQIVSILAEYFSAPDRFENLWNSLGEADRTIVSLHIWSNGSEPAQLADEIAEEFGVAEIQKNSYYSYWWDGLSKYKEQYAGEKSSLWLLFPGSGYSSGGINPLFISSIRNEVGEMKRDYSKVSDLRRFTSREGRADDFINAVRFCNSNNPTLTKGGTLSKPSALKLRNFCAYEEYSNDINEKPEDVRSTDSLMVTHPLTTLCIIGGLLTDIEGKCVPSGRSAQLIDQPREQLVKTVFDAYMISKSFDEISMIRGITPKRGHRPFMARQNIAEELRNCPVGRPLYVKEFERFLRVANRAFARKETNHVVSAGSSKYYYAVGWETYERTLIRIILSFFWTLGIIDIAWNERGQYDAGIVTRIPVAIRVNKLGAYVLGLSDSYTMPVAPEQKLKGGFTVLPDYTIVVPDSTDRVKHELYFERFFTKASSTTEASIYKLDFETIVRAIDNGSSVKALRKYLAGSDKPMPENVAHAINDWEKQTGRIRLRQVTILECDDAALLEEVTHYKGMGEFVKGKIGAAVVVDGSAAPKIKKAIEKNKRFCTNGL